MNYQYFIHPDDAAALKVLQGIPGLPKVVDWYMKNGMEKISWLQNTSYSIKLSRTQMPEIYNRLPPICERLGISVPDLYLDMDITPNAWTSGIHYVYITLTRGLIRRFSPEEIDAVLAHECGHILCQHTYYQAIASEFLSMMEVASDENIVGSIVSFIGSTAMVPLKNAFLSWQRKSELSADRAASIIADKDVFLRVMAKLSQIPKPILDTLDLKEWASQGRSIRDFESQGLMQKALKFMSGIESSTHPPEVLRAYEFIQWVDSSQFKRIPSRADGTKYLPKMDVKTNSSANPSMMSERKTALLELKEMLDLGIITKEDFESQKKKILGI